VYNMHYINLDARARRWFMPVTPATQEMEIGD
jgi:hypothetical protein